MDNQKKRFSYSSVGNSKLINEKGEILVTNDLNSIINGVCVDVSKEKKHEFKLKEVKIGKDSSFNISHFGTDYYGRVKCLGQQSIFYLPSKNEVAFAFNSKLLPNKVSLVGKLKGNIVFKGEYLVPRNDLKINWWWIVTAVASGVAYLVDKIDYDSDVVRTDSSDGTWTQTTSTHKSFSGSVKNPDTGEETDIVNYRTFDGIEFKADDLYLEYSSIVDGCTPLPKLTHILFNSKNINQFKILN